MAQRAFKWPVFRFEARMRPVRRETPLQEETGDRADKLTAAVTLQLRWKFSVSMAFKWLLRSGT